MTIAMDDLRRLLDAKSLKYFLAPDRPMILLAGVGQSGFLQLSLHLESEGRFLQFRSMSYLQCPPEHPNLVPLLRLLLTLNYRFRLVKFAWDATDGEIVAYLDHVLMDGSLTSEQFDALFNIYMQALDFNHYRIKMTIETGEDPGEGAVPGKPVAGSDKPPSAGPTGGPGAGPVDEI